MVICEKMANMGISDVSEACLGAALSVCRCMGSAVAYTGRGEGQQGQMCCYRPYWELLDGWHMVIKRAERLWSVLVLMFKLATDNDPLIACARVVTLPCSMPPAPPFPPPCAPLAADSVIP